MFRTLKYYNMPLRTSAHSKTTVPGHMISFSGYPGVITSGDDFYTTSSGLVALETTIGNSNTSLWQQVTSTGQVRYRIYFLLKDVFSSNYLTEKQKMHFKNIWNLFFQLFETMRSLIALRLANNGHSWCEYFSEYNSGTYNNQWMIVDLNKFKKR